jgi:hypothetical protein
MYAQHGYELMECKSPGRTIVDDRQTAQVFLSEADFLTIRIFDLNY